jgi:hypothetical protein
MSPALRPVREILAKLERKPEPLPPHARPLIFQKQKIWLNVSRHLFLAFRHLPMSEHQNVEHLRREAAELREAAAIVQDLQFREQLLGIARQYEATASQLDAQGRSEAA